MKQKSKTKIWIKDLVVWIDTDYLIETFTSKWVVKFVLLIYWKYFRPNFVSSSYAPSSVDFKHYVVSTSQSSNVLKYEKTQKTFYFLNRLNRSIRKKFFQGAGELFNKPHSRHGELKNGIGMTRFPLLYKFIEFLPARNIDF